MTLFRGSHPTSPAVVAVAALLLAVCSYPVAGQTTALTCTTPLDTSGTSIQMFGLGYNGYQQLGFSGSNRIGTFTLSSPGTSTGIDKISGSLLHTIILDNDGKAWTSGDGAYGRLGLGPLYLATSSFYRIGTVVDVDVPVVLSNRLFRDVAAGWNHSCYIIEYNSRGRVYCTGSNSDGQLGNSDLTTNITLPYFTTSTVAGFSTADFSKVAAGSDATAAVTSGGDLWVWGNNEQNQLGINDTTTTKVYSPSRIVGLDGITVTDVSCGYRYCVCLTDGGAVYGWGVNSNGQMGPTVAIGAVATTPVLLIESGATSISAGGAHVLAIVNGVATSWGYGTFGQTAQPSPYAAGVKADWNVKTPTTIPSLATVQVYSISAGMRHSVILDNCGKMYFFGSDAFGQLGQGFIGAKDLFRSLTPKQIARVVSLKLSVVGAYAGAYNSFFTIRRN